MLNDQRSLIKEKKRNILLYIDCFWKKYYKCFIYFIHLYSHIIYIDSNTNICVSNYTFLGPTN